MLCNFVIDPLPVFKLKQDLSIIRPYLETSELLNSRNFHSPEGSKDLEVLRNSYEVRSRNIEMRKQTQSELPSLRDQTLSYDSNSMYFAK